MALKLVLSTSLRVALADNTATPCSAEYSTSALPKLSTGLSLTAATVMS